MRLSGYAAVFDSLSVDLGGFRETIAPGAFARSLREGHQFAVHYHDFADLLGSTRSGTLKLSEDTRGLYFELEVPDTSLGRDVHELVRRGDLAHMSFLFGVNGSAGESWRELPNGMLERTLLDVDLFEVSTVAKPAYHATNVKAGSFVRSSPESLSTPTNTRNRLLRRHMQARLSAINTR